MPEAGTLSNGRRGWLLIALIAGTERQHRAFAPGKLATAGIARRLGSSSPGFCHRGHLDFVTLLTLASVGRRLTVANVPYVHVVIIYTHVHTEGILALSHSRCSVVKIAFSSHRAARWDARPAHASDGQDQDFSGGAVGAGRYSVQQLTSHTTFACSRPHRA